MLISYFRVGVKSFVFFAYVFCINRDNKRAIFCKYGLLLIAISYDSFARVQYSKNFKWRFDDYLVNHCSVSIYTGVHKVRVHFKKIITLIVFAIEIICKKDLKEENRYFLRFY